VNVLDSAIAAVVPRLPQSVVGRVSRKYIAGETLDSALDATRALNQCGMSVTLDVLGENIDSAGQADPTVKTYRDALSEMDSRSLDGNISIKLTHLGLRVDRAACEANARAIVADAHRRGIFVRVDMEDSGTTDATLEVFRELRSEFSGVGIVLQSALRRSEADARALAAEGARVRVCKGIYREPKAIAFQDATEIRHSFLRLVDILLGHGCHVAIATHDDELVEKSGHLLEERGGCDGSYEYQMLLGVREDLRRDLVAAGHPMRVYVPFGQDWYAYSIRRLKENPRIAGHIARAMLRRRG
jgi:proline dehydrogenase